MRIVAYSVAKGGFASTLRSPSPFRAPGQAVVDDALQELVVRQACRLGRLGEVFPVGQLRVGVGLEHVDAGRVATGQRDW